MSLQDNSNKCDCNECHDDLIKFLENIVEETYDYKRKYFEFHPIEDAINRITNIDSRVKKNLDIFKKHEKLGLCINKVYYYFLKGKLINIKSNYDQEAEELLSKAIKLDPKLVDAWNELGECYCKNEDVIKAKSCFEGALKEKRNKISLRNLSILIRQQCCSNSAEKLKNIEKGLAYAKEAIQLDPSDGLSWAILGNAYLSSYFGILQHPNALKQCLNAYAQAEKDSVAKSSSDLHYNKGITLQYQEEFKLALESYNCAFLYSPDWMVPKVKEEQLLKYLQEIQDLVTSKGKLKPKKIQQILKSIKSNQLGPYGGGSYSSSRGEKINLIETSYEDLQAGFNAEKVMVGKVICSVRNEDTVPFTFCSIDKSGSVIVNTVFNLGNGKGVIIGDSVAIPEPYVTDVDFSYRDNDFKFRMVRIETPVIMVVNSRKLNRSNQVDVQLSLSKTFD